MKNNKQAFPYKLHLSIDFCDLLFCHFFSFFPPEKLPKKILKVKTAKCDGIKQRERRMQSQGSGQEKVHRTERERAGEQIIHSQERRSVKEKKRLNVEQQTDRQITTKLRLADSCESRI